VHRQQPRLLDQLRDCMRLKQCSMRTKEAYEEWVRRFVLFQRECDPRDMGRPSGGVPDPPCRLKKGLHIHPESGEERASFSL
jgi:Phage integrase, N-terminal SAM-like domain